MFVAAPGHKEHIPSDQHINARMHSLKYDLRQRFERIAGAKIDGIE